MNCHSLRISILIQYVHFLGHILHIVHNFPNHEKYSESIRQEVLSCFV